jgi:hypothetical protein
LTGFTCEFVYSARVVVLGALGPPWFLEFLYCVSALECGTDVGVFEDIGHFSYFWAVVGKDIYYEEVFIR